MSVTSYSNIDEIDIFQKGYNYKIKFLGAVKTEYDAVIELYFMSHGSFYSLKFMNSYPDNPCIVCDKFKDIDEFKTDIMEIIKIFENAKIYKIPTDKQTINGIIVTPSYIDCDIFKLNFTQMNFNELSYKSHLIIDQDFLIDQTQYIDVTLELLNIKNKEEFLAK
jgi:hypothetical protein